MIVKEESFTPPQDVASAARQGLKLREQFKRGGTHIGARRGTQLANREAVSVSTLRRMVSYFARHAVDAQAAGWEDREDPSPGWIAWLLWGGDAGKRWAESIINRIDREQVDKTKAADELVNVWVGLEFPPDIANQFDATQLRGNRPHVTALFGRIERERAPMVRQIIEDVISSNRPVMLSIGRPVGYFSADGETVAWVSVESDTLRDLNVHLVASITAASTGFTFTYDEYRPHATLGYLPAGAKWHGQIPSGTALIRSAAVSIDGARSVVTLGDDIEDDWPDDMSRQDIQMAAPKVSIEKPFANQHAARQQEPDDEKFSTYRRYHPDGWTDGVDAILGIRHGGSSEIQSIRFDDAKFSPDEARKWLKDNGFKTGKFETSASYSRQK